MAVLSSHDLNAYSERLPRRAVEGTIQDERVDQMSSCSRYRALCDGP